MPRTPALTKDDMTGYLFAQVSNPNPAQAVKIKFVAYGSKNGGHEDHHTSEHKLEGSVLLDGTFTASHDFPAIESTAPIYTEVSGSIILTYDIVIELISYIENANSAELKVKTYIRKDLNGVITKGFSHTSTFEIVKATKYHRAPATRRVPVTRKHAPRAGSSRRG